MGTWTKSLKNSPKQYLQGWVEFYKLRFKVDERVLIPRPETELLVDIVIATVGKQSSTILDLGTGSGNIAISIAKNLPKAHIFATDISKDALTLAKENAKLHGVEDRIFFMESDLLEKIASPHSSSVGPPSAPRNDNLIIVTNLPYIPRGRIPYLDPSVKDFEPWIALDGGSDGFDLYRRLFQQISQQPRRLQPKLIVGEIDYTHGDLSFQEAKKYFPEASVEVKTDLAEKQRILLIKPYLFIRQLFQSSC